MCPQITQINADGRSQNPSAWRGLGRRRTTAGNRCAGTSLRTQAFVAMSRPAACTLEERRPRHPSSLLDVWMVSPVPNRRGARRNRRAPGASAGGKHCCDERLRSEQTCFSPVGGDRLIADCSAINRGYDLSVSARFPLRICVIWVICGQIAMGGWLCDSSVSLCLCGFIGALGVLVVSQPVEFRITARWTR